MSKATLNFAAALTLLLSSSSFAQFQKTSHAELRTKVMPVSEVREGMRGTAKTVFRGSKPEEFNVEILGVIPNFVGPKQDMIIGKLSGANAERTFVFAGMSGSPVYVDGKLVGAIAYSFPFAKEPICGITPFEQMTSLVETAPKPRSGNARPVSIAELAAEVWDPSFGAPSTTATLTGVPGNSRLSEVVGQTLTRISTPVAFSGVSQQVLNLYADQLLKAGLLPVAASTVGDAAMGPMKKASDTTLLGGDSVVVHLSRGDIGIAAAGTVTHREGDQIYAFGHPFFGLGVTSLPMSESHVVTVVPNTNNSFKLAVADAMVGSMTQDRATTIYGRLGEPARMMPVRIKLTTSRGKTEEIKFESAVDELLSPLIVNVGIAQALTAAERAVGQSTLSIEGEIRVKGTDPLKITRRVTGMQSTVMAASAAAAPLAALLRAGFDDLVITGVDINITAVDGSRTAVLDRLSTDRKEVRPGQTVNVTAYERTPAGQLVRREIPLTIPADTAPGTVTILVGDGNSVQHGSAITQFVPSSAADIIANYNRLKRPDQLYAVITRSMPGTVIGSSELPNLPPSMLATINNERSTGGTRTVLQKVILEKQLPAGENIVSGSQTVTIDVIR